MDSKRWMKENLKKISNIFERLQIRYAFDDLSNTHFVYISPDTILEDAVYLEVETKLRINFIEDYAFESLCFLTEEDIISLENMEILYEHHPEVADTQLPIKPLIEESLVVFTSESIEMEVCTSKAVDVHENFLVGNSYTEFDIFSKNEYKKITNFEMAA